MADEHLYPFQVSEAELHERMDRIVDVTIGSLSSFYLELPRGDNFLEYEQFRRAYDTLRIETGNFRALDRYVVEQAVQENSLILVILRCIVGLTPPELADMASDTSGVAVEQGFARAQDQRARRGQAFGKSADTTARINALIDAACSAIEQGPSAPSPQLIHRLFKVDTERGLASVQSVANNGVAYSELLYERMLGRPFATHRDSVSGLVGDIVEQAVVDELEVAGVPYHRTQNGEVIPGFDQAPDFLIPDRINPRVIIEAKLTQDDGTARDKITRVQHLAQLSENESKFQVIACIDGRGFKIRRQDMRKLIIATKGKVFSVTTMPHLVEQSGLRQFARK